MKKIKKTLLYLFGFAALLLLITVIINLPAFDEDLLPEVVAIKNIKAESFDENNAYPALIAINSPSGPDLKEVTETIRDQLNQQIANTGFDFLSEDRQNELAGGDDSSWKNAFYQCRSRTDKGCMLGLVNDLLNKPINDNRLTSQLKRYESLLEFTDLREATQMRFDSPLISLGSTLALKRFYLALAYINRSSEGYVSAWQKDTEFWRMVLAKSHLLITRMVAIATITTSIDSLSFSIQQGSLKPLQLNQLQGDIKTLSQYEIDMGKTFEYEFKYGMTMYDEMYEQGAIGNFLENLLYQHQATLNTNYLSSIKPLKRVSAMNSTEFYQFINSQQYNKTFSSSFNWSPTTLYNPMGKLLVGYGTPAYKAYIARAHDLNGMFYLMKLQIEIALNPGRPVEQVISQSQYTNPYTLEPMSYNQDTHSIYFQCMDKTSVCELDL